MISRESSSDLSEECIIETEKDSLVDHSHYKPKRRRSWSASRAHVVILYVMNILLLVVAGVLVSQLAQRPFQDPTVGVYCKNFTLSLELNCINLFRTAPANDAIEYVKEFKFRAALFEKTPYMGFPSDETDRLWEELYNCESKGIL